jgi:ABC-type glycerol-3-phosphate transport system substrate-binding protein
MKLSRMVVAVIGLAILAFVCGGSESAESNVVEVIVASDTATVLDRSREGRRWLVR